MLQAALSAGLATEGADVIDLGVLPTPGVATVAERPQAAGRHGLGLAQSVRRQRDKALQLVGHEAARRRSKPTSTREITSILDDPDGPPRRPTGHGVGRIIDEPDGGRPLPRASGGGHRRAHLRRAAHRGRLRQRRRQCVRARGPGRLGATVTALYDTPDGTNINERCGSTDPGELARAVAESGADLGLALDGDADRVIAVDHTGIGGRRRRPPGPVRPRPGQPWSPGRQHGGGDRHDQPRIPPGHGVARHRRPGDRRGRPPRAGRARRRRPRPGRRAVGPHHLPHPIDHRRRHPHRDRPGGPHAALRAVRWPTWPTDWSSGCPRCWSTCPSRNPGAWPTAPRSGRRWPEAEVELGHEGRVLLRPSGTEPLVRVMVEARLEDQANDGGGPAGRGRRGRARSSGGLRPVLATGSRSRARQANSPR